ncbi:hypothetical protein ACFU7Y_27890 [Kitasatospora sp. NPDC057542]|uniref:hypothetical protein n=1 Tax=Kitasatospora sp. NPDC057542 TaxID=3346162 RepID=UPI0036A849C9
MTTTFETRDGVESTIALLERELPALQEQQERLESELSAVTGRLEAVRAALDSLRSLAAAPLLHPAPAVLAEAVEEARPVPAEQFEAEVPRARTGGAAKARPVTGRKRAEADKPVRARKTGKAKPAPQAAAAPQASRTADAVVNFLATAGEPVRARDVALALGREDTPNAVNAVRTALERLVKASRAQRVGRGLYTATEH